MNAPARGASGDDVPGGVHGEARRDGGHALGVGKFRGEDTLRRVKNFDLSLHRADHGAVRARRPHSSERQHPPPSLVVVLNLQYGFRVLVDRAALGTPHTQQIVIARRE